MSLFMFEWKRKLRLTAVMTNSVLSIFTGLMAVAEPVLARTLAPQIRPVSTSALPQANANIVHITSLNTSPPTLLYIQPAAMLSGIEQEYQGWNNCGPATLKMNLGYYGRADTQREIAAFTKPNDKSVSAQELAAYAQKVGMNGLVRENGSLEQLKLLISNGIPVIIETGYVTASGREGWMSHFKLLIGYDNEQVTFMDSYAGPNQNVSFEAMEADWREVNRRYLIVFPSDKEPIVRAIIGDDLADATMYTHGVEQAPTSPT